MVIIFASLVITASSVSIPMSMKPMSIADHQCIDCVQAMRRPSMPPLMFLSETFVSCKSNISGMILPTSANNCCKGILKILKRLVNDYVTVLRTVLEKHVPITNRLRRRARPCPWYTNDVKEAKQMAIYP